MLKQEEQKIIKLLYIVEIQVCKPQGYFISKNICREFKTKKQI